MSRTTLSELPINSPSTPRMKSLVELDTTKSAIGQLKERYPGRETQIDRLAQCLGSTHAMNGPLFIYGPPSSGKTSVTLDFARFMGIGHAYINCHETHRTRTILTSIIHQLKGNKRRRDEGYDTNIRCDSLNEFLITLPTAIASHKRTPCIILDAVERIASNNNELLTALTRVPFITSAKVHIIFMSALPWGTGRFNLDGQRILPPIHLHFSAYNHVQLLKILLHRQPPSINKSPFSSFYRSFLQAILPAFNRTTNSILDIQTAAERLWPLYISPLYEGKQLQGPALLSRIRNNVHTMISELELGGIIGTPPLLNSTNPPLQVNGSSVNTAMANEQNTNTFVSAPAAATGISSMAIMDNERKASSHGLAFELPYMSKFLLLSAYIASRNKATSDRAVFDPGYSRRGRKDAQSHDRQTEAAIEAALRGPHSFPLERLLHIFYCIYEQHGPSEDEEAGDDATLMVMQQQQQQTSRRMWTEVQSAEVNMQLSTLVALRLLSRSSSDLLEDGIYKCNISDSVALAIASNVKLRLGDYLKLA